MRHVAIHLVALAAIACLLPSAASASELVARNTSGESLAVNARGTALVTYDDAAGVRRRVLYWGGINRTLRFAHHDRSGGAISRRANWRTLRNACGTYTGPQLAYLVTACTMPDGSHWALQRWMRSIPNYGGVDGPTDLRLSHFRGDIAFLWIATDWSWGGRFSHMYGQYIYQGQGVYGHSWRPDGYVLDQLGRNVAVDSFNSDYGPGWRRVNAFLSNAPNGQFCFGFAPKGGSAASGRSATEWYRASVVGPGVSPDVMTYFRGQTGAYDPQLDAQHNYWQARLSGNAASGPCSKPN